jgi:hypothetical protein
MDNELVVAEVRRQRLAHVVADQAERAGVVEPREPRRHAPGEIIDDRQPDRLNAGGGAVEVGDGLDEVMPQEPRPAGDEQPLPRDRVQLVGGRVADVRQIFCDDVGRRLTHTL